MACLWVFVFLMYILPSTHASYEWLNIPLLNEHQTITVATDGTGEFHSIQMALDMVENNSMLTYIHVKEGTYHEIVSINKNNIIIFGDGIGKTIITSDVSNSSGSNVHTSVMHVIANNVLIKDMSIINSAGPEGNQAVALEFNGNNISCYKCSVEGYQDTLFVNNGVHFFYECHVYGTIDFIFGNAAVVIQNSVIHVRVPKQGQENVITAQGRIEANQDTGIVIHNCSIIPTSELANQPDVKTYLGRPWKMYSRTIIIESNLDKFIDPSGWVAGDKFDGKSVYYAEFSNRGTGASADGRVKWPGYHLIKDKGEIEHFTVSNFIHGSSWLPVLGVPFTGGFAG